MVIHVSSLIGLVLFGVICWLVDTYVPMIAVVKSVFRIVVIIIAIVWLLNVFGIFTIPITIH